VSDDLARLGPDARQLLDEVIERGRAADAGARAGRPPRCDGLLDPQGPVGLAGAGGTVRVDLPSGHGGLV
jgi:hypothetical protein